MPYPPDHSPAVFGSFQRIIRQDRGLAGFGILSVIRTPLSRRLEFFEFEYERLPGYSSNDTLAYPEVVDIGVFYNIALTQLLGYPVGLHAGHISLLLYIVSAEVLDEFTRRAVVDLERERRAESGKHAAPGVLAVSRQHLVDVLDADEELGSEASSEVDAVVHMIEHRQEPELIDEEIHTSFILTARKRLFDSKIDQQSVDRRQNCTYAQIVLDENDPAALAADDVAHRKRSLLAEAAYEDLPDQLLQLGHDAESLAGFRIENVRLHGFEV